MEALILGLLFLLGAGFKLRAWYRNAKTKIWVEPEQEVEVAPPPYRPRPRRSYTPEEVRLAKEIDDLTK
jgi:hypothetical protein